jgi:hydroxypyruvate reductase
MVTVENRDALAPSEARDVALACIEAGIEAAHPDAVVEDRVNIDGNTLLVGDSTYELDAFDRVLALGGGKAASHAARGLESVVGERLDGGAVVTDGPTETERVDVLPGGHPKPSVESVESTERIRELARSADADTLVLAIVTGGASALLASPADSLELADVQRTTDALLESGAPIDAVNAVRKHISTVKGGQLAREIAPATTVTVAFSDVVGNDPAVIGSGPTVPDDSTFGDAARALEKHDVEVSDAVSDRIEQGARGESNVSETPTADEPLFDRVSVHVLADNWTALDAARDEGRDREFTPLVLSSLVEGEAREVGRFHAAIGREVAATGTPVEPPAVLLSGGECTVARHGDDADGGTGGPNLECALAAAPRLPSGAVFASVDTDGVDGTSDAAGAVVDADTAAEDAASAALGEHDSAGFLVGRNALVRTGKTGTNVNDLRVLVVPARE